ncbi:MAG: Histone H1-like nucleoprotein, partial [Frankiaceae bacterium]|nr:Histone H1-like nucleoprotein [Frankiaceae bacterium]
TGLGALLSGYLTKTFYEGHRAAMRQLNLYYREPYMTGRLLAAERIIGKLDNNAANRKFAEEIVKGLLEWQLPPVEDVTGPSTGADPDAGNGNADPAKKTTAKKTARKAPAKKTAKRAPAKKVTAKKATAKKATA